MMGIATFATLLNTNSFMLAKSWRISQEKKGNKQEGLKRKNKNLKTSSEP